MKCYAYLLLLIVMISCICSCKKSFLQVEDQSVVVRQQYVKDLESLDKFVNGIYVMLTQDFYDGRNQVYGEVIADNVKAKSGGNQLVQEYKWSQRSDVTGINLYPQYRILKACNFAIEKATEFKNENVSRADNLKAQVLTIRALINFTLVNVYAQSYNFTADASHPGIALVTSSNPFEHISKRNTVSEVYSAITNDLNSSIPLFSADNIPSKLLISRVAAKALLARVLLFKGDYAAAKNLAKEVLAKVPLMPAANFPTNLFSYTETEAVFQLLPSATNLAAGAFNTNFQGRYFQGSNSQIQFFATTDIATLLTADPADSRKKWVTLVSGNWRITKYPVDVITGFNPTSLSYYPSILRSSEMCLTAAEAYANLGGSNEDSARILLDNIRMRANPGALSTTATGSDLLNLIYAERRKELAFEGLRMFDLLRWKKGVTRSSDVTNGATATLPYPSNLAIAPIPLQDIQITGLQQNPGY